MGDIRSKFEILKEEEKEQSYTGLGNLPDSIDYTYKEKMTKNIDVKPSIESRDESRFIFRNILDYFKEWQESWEQYNNNSFNGFPKPIDADQFARELSRMYKIKSR